MKKFSNWSGSLVFHPNEIVYPDSMDGIMQTVRQANHSGKRIRLVGAGHSWMPLIKTHDILISLDQWQGVEAVDKEKMTAVVRAGTRLEQVGAELHAHGVAMENLGDITDQSIAGAFLTGTHGTGVNYGILATQLIGVTLVTAFGEVLEWNEDDHPEMMNAVRVSFGALGIVAKMTLRVQPDYKLHEKQYRYPLADVLANVEQFKEENRHFEFFWFPHADSVVIKQLNPTEGEIAQGSTFDAWLEAYVVNGVWWLTKSLPRLGPALNRFMMRLVDEKTDGHVNYAHNVFPSVRSLRFNEMEYNIPAENWSACYQEIVDLYNSPNFNIFFAIETRWAKQDEIWLSPAYQRESAYIAVHQIAGVPYKAQFARIEAIFRKYNGRPHWGKLNTMTKEEALANYPKLADFMALRTQLDPQGIFLNDYMKQMF